MAPSGTRFEAHPIISAWAQHDLAGLRCGALVGDLLDATAQRLELGSTRLLGRM